MSVSHSALNALSRRNWLATTTGAVAAAALAPAAFAAPTAPTSHARLAHLPELSADRIDITEWEALAQRAVDAAMAAGAQYADARLTRTTQQTFNIMSLRQDQLTVGAGVRALYNGYWGYAAHPMIGADEIVQLAQSAVAQAKTNAKGTPRTVELGKIPPARGRWSTPVKIDPFTVPIEEKLALMRSWVDIDMSLAPYRRLPMVGAGPQSPVTLGVMWCGYNFVRQERVVATSEGSLFTQTLFESGGTLRWAQGPVLWPVGVTGIDPVGKGWELFLETNIEEQIRTIEPKLVEYKLAQANARPTLVGRKTIVCDGMSMASLLEQTMGVATQLDRALGFEANAGGTSFLTDPLAMVGSFPIAAPGVTITADRSMPGGLATVKWDDEGVAPDTATLVKNGILTDFQTTRESAGWLAPYYQKVGQPARSHGHAAAENALATTMQHMPNLSLMSAKEGPSLDELIASVADGLLVTNMPPLVIVGAQSFAPTDHQARNGMLGGAMRHIKNGRLGAYAQGGAVLFNTLDLWKHVATLGGASTTTVLGSSQYPYGADNPVFVFWGPSGTLKGQPAQLTGHSISAPAAVITEQAIIDPSRRA